MELDKKDHFNPAAALVCHVSSTSTRLHTNKISACWGGDGEEGFTAFLSTLHHTYQGNVKLWHLEGKFSPTHSLSEVEGYLRIQQEKRNVSEASVSVRSRQAFCFASQLHTAWEAPSDISRQTCSLNWTWPKVSGGVWGCNGSFETGGKKSKCSQLWHVAPEYPVPEQSQEKELHVWEQRAPCSHRLGKHLRNSRETTDQSRKTTSTIYTLSIHLSPGCRDNMEIKS